MSAGSFSGLTANSAALEVNSEEPVSYGKDRRFTGSQRLYGTAALEAFRGAHVAVVGVGGVGSWAVEALARGGIGRLTMVDFDHIAQSNINRQVHALDSTVGAAKVVAMQQRVAQISPQCAVHGIEAFADAQNWPGILLEPADAVIDACDQMHAKLALARWALSNRTLFVTVGAAGGKRYAHRVEIGDLSEATHDPLLAKLRYGLRRARAAPGVGRKMGVCCVYSPEPVRRADAACDRQTDQGLNCHGYGSSVAVTATFGLCAAGWIMDRISCRVRSEMRIGI